jgi:hypothetical protein
MRKQSKELEDFYRSMGRGPQDPEARKQAQADRDKARQGGNVWAESPGHEETIREPLSRGCGLAEYRSAKGATPIPVEIHWPKLPWWALVAALLCTAALKCQTKSFLV